MIDDIIFGLGFVAVIEGLVLALAPNRLKQALLLLVTVRSEKLSVIALIIIAIGVALIWWARR
ncbi:MAG: DUF2065 domain-containing protein [Rhodobacteraceae bacterium]|nr:DUF2065 domain-containing protein [Paracoccaceae bacterium]